MRGQGRFQAAEEGGQALEDVLPFPERGLQAPDRGRENRMRLDERGQGLGPQRRLGRQSEMERPRHQIHLGHAQRLGPEAQGRVAQQAVDLAGQRSITVADLRSQGIDLPGVPHLGKALVERHALVDLGNVRLGDAHLQAQVKGRARAVPRLLALQLQDGLLEELDVQVQADGLDVAALLAPQQVARPPQLEVQGRDAEARPQVRELADGGQALPRDLGEHGVGRDEKIGEGSPVGAPDAAPELVELGQAVAVRAVDDHGVGAGDVEAVLDDGGGHQHVRPALHEGEHDLLERRLRHLAVGHRDPRFGDQALHHGGQRADRLHAVVDEVDLAVPGQLLADRARDHVGRELDDHGLDGQAVLGRGLDDRHVADAGQAHLQRARDGGGGEGEAVHGGLELLQLLLGRHPEALLLVHHQEAEVAEDHVFREQAVGAEQDVDPPLARPLEDGLDLLRGPESRDHVHRDRERRKALTERLPVLEGQDGGGSEEGHLLAVEHRAHGRAHGHLGLAVAHVAAHQAVHGGGVRHVRGHVGDGRRLVGGLLVLEGLLELPLPRALPGESVAGARLALGVELEQLHRHVAHGLPDALLDLLPGAAAQLVDGRPVPLDARVQGNRPAIDKLGSGTWEKVKKRVRKAMRDMAVELLQLYAERKARPGHAFAGESPWQREFEEAFEYEETPDQAAAIADVAADMADATPMDRLVCGDVGYGKTEVAMRAAMRAVLDGKQVALLTPTTILAFQHWKTFRKRFAPFPVPVDMVSRFRTAKEIKTVLQGTGEGRIDVLLGTHRLLSKDVVFRDLGLLVVDEEQRFGVAAKEKLKQLKTTVDCLTLSATPIPRTLQMGLAGIRDMSVIETPPKDRLAIQTMVVKFSTDVITSAIRQELARDGQVYFVHNRVESIYAVASMVQRLVPEARVAVAHGQMPEAALEKVMLAFVEGRADVLVATTIIENGLDIPRANTMVINRADRYGLAQLYQLRGRVGRSDRRAFAYLLVPPDTVLSEVARKRLGAIREFSDLGAGFRIAALDLELRGAGNLLGGEQSGHIQAVG